ncbi:MAG: NAD-dependent epimerase/dehydratase family protein [Gemmatimonadota bacterium]
MTTLVTGATGFVGRHLAPLLVARGEPLRCLVRPTSDRRALEAAGAELVVGDVTDARAAAAAAAGCRRVVHLANLYSLWEPDPRVYHQVNVEGTRLLLEAALAAGVEHFLHVSTVAVFGRPAHLPFNEDTPPGPVRFSEYARSKAAGDALARDCARRGLPLTIAYPAAVLGPGDPQSTGRYIADVLAGRMPAALFSASLLTAVHVRDVAAALAAILGRPDTIGRQYIIGREQLTLGQLTDLIAAIGGVRRPWPPVPDALAGAGAALLDGLARLLRRPPLWGLSLDAARTLRAGVCADGSRAERELGLTYTPIRVAVEEAVQALRQSP